jgi:hypothetical protein
MLRVPENIPRCPMCNESTLTPPTLIQHSAEGTPQVHFKLKGGQPNFFGVTPGETFAVQRASVCLTCGHVALGLTAGTLQRLKDRLGALDPM